MQKNTFGPVLTLAAVAALGGGIWVANLAHEDAPTAPAPVAQEVVSPAPTRAPVPTTTPSPAAFPATAHYVGKIPTAAGVITLEVTVDGRKAIAYACDGNSVEVWLRGSATNGLLALASKDETSRLDARLDGAFLGGTLSIGQKSWDFTAAPVAPPGGLYVYENEGLRNQGRR